MENEKKESDIKKIVREHMENEHHVISDDEFRNAEVGQTPPDEIKTGAGAAISADLESETEKLDKDGPASRQITPWDTTT